MWCTALHIENGPALCAGHRRRENGVAALPPGIVRGALFLVAVCWLLVAGCWLLVAGRRQPPLSQFAVASN